MRALAATSIVLAAAQFGCGAKPPPQTGPDPCVAGEAHLRQKLGPELSRFEAKQPLEPARGCAIVYLKVAEEMPEEMPDGEEIKMDTDHELAFAFVRGSGVGVDQIARSAMAPGPVVMKLKSSDITGDGIAELVVEEKQGEFGMTKYRGLRIFDWSRGTSREIFSEQLTITTPEGLSIVPEWQVGMVDGTTRAIMFEGAGTKKVFAWDAGAGKFVHRESKTPAAKAEPAPAAAAPAGDKAKEDEKKKKGTNVLDELGL